MNELEKVMRYYEVWLKVFNIPYKVNKWKKNFKKFMKFCEENEIDYYKFIDFMFLSGRRIQPWSLGRLDFSLVDEFRSWKGLSVLELLKKELEEWRKLKQLYEKMGIKSKEHLFLVCKGDVYFKEFEFSEFARRFLRKIGIDNERKRIYNLFYTFLKRSEKEVGYEDRSGKEDTQEIDDGFEVCYEVY